MQGCICACVHVCGVYVWVHGLHVQCVKSVHVFVCLSLEIGIYSTCVLSTYVCMTVLYVYMYACMACMCNVFIVLICMCLLISKYICSYTNHCFEEKLQISNGTCQHL